MSNYEQPPPYAPSDPHPKADGVTAGTASDGAFHPGPPPMQGYPIQSQSQAYIPLGQNPNAVPNYGSTTIITQRPEVIFLGGCPACKVGILEDDYTILGICCAILFFPLGILCCLLLRQRRCANCNAVFS